MKIGEFSRITGASERSLRYYEQEGLLAAARTSGGQREYAEEDVARVRRIRVLLAAGLNLATVAEVLPCMDETTGGPNEHTTPLLSESLLQQRDRIDSCIAELEESRRALDDVIATAAPAATARA
jgi:DNA-binding transcriptional MerR regulator